MKIITKGKWKHFVECHTCEAELLLDATDVKLHTATQNAGDREFFFFVCPCCECDEEVPANDVPADVRKVAYDGSTTLPPMSWADSYIASLLAGENVQFRPRGNSMQGKIESGQLVTVVPAIHPVPVGSIVLCKVSGSQYLHQVLAVGSDERYQIGNNKGHVNGWCTAANVFGVVTAVEN